MNSGLEHHVVNVPQSALEKFRALQGNHPAASEVVQRIQNSLSLPKLGRIQTPDTAEKHSSVQRACRPISTVTASGPEKATEEWPELRCPAEVAMDAAMRGITSLIRVVAPSRENLDAAPRQTNQIEPKPQEKAVATQPYESVLDRLEQSKPKLAPPREDLDGSIGFLLGQKTETRVDCSEKPKAQTAAFQRGKLSLDRLTAGNFTPTTHLTSKVESHPSGVLGFVQKQLKTLARES